jgi:hypothetical protein
MRGIGEGRGKGPEIPPRTGNRPCPMGVCFSSQYRRVVIPFYMGSNVSLPNTLISLPHAPFEEVHVGENFLQLYTYGRDLYGREI